MKINKILFKKKQSMKKQILLFLATLLLFSCSKEDATTNVPTLTLPTETQVGANTFGCYINGKLLVPRSGTGTVGGSDRAVTVWGDVSGNQKYDEIEVKDFKSTRTAQILIHIQSLHQLGSGDYNVDLSNGLRGIDGLNNNYIHCRVFNENTNSYQYYRSFDNCGTINITRYDFANDVIAGTFTCRVRNSVNPADEIQITQGRFDINPVSILDKIFP
jgi:hypothetical protein